MATVRFKGLVGPSYQLRDSQYEAEECINLFPQVSETGNGRSAEVATLSRTPGLITLCAGTSTGTNGAYIASTGDCYQQCPDGLYKITGVSGSTSGWTRTLLTGGMAVGPGPVTFSDNGIVGGYLFVAGENLTYSYSFLTNTSTVLNTTISNPTTATYIDGYVVFPDAGTNQFYWTDLYTNNIEALNFSSAEANSDYVTACFSNNEDLWVFGPKVTEIWYDYGQNNYVFQRRGGLLVETGCASPYTICKTSVSGGSPGNIFFLSSSDRSGPNVVVTQGYTPTRISTFAVEQSFSQVTQDQLSSAQGFSFEQEGCLFYALQIEGLNYTWVYDFTNSNLYQKPLWHKRSYTDPNTGIQSQWRAAYCVMFQNTMLAFDNVNGSVYSLTFDAYDDAGAPITRQRTTPYIVNNMNRMFYNWLALDIKAGVGNDTTITPTVYLQFSNNNGNTWSNPLPNSPGAMGSYATRVIWYQLGEARSRLFRLTMTDPVDWAISGAAIDLTPGNF